MHDRCAGSLGHILSVLGKLRFTGHYEVRSETLSQRTYRLPPPQPHLGYKGRDEGGGAKRQVLKAPRDQGSPYLFFLPQDTLSLGNSYRGAAPSQHQVMEGSKPQEPSLTSSAGSPGKCLQPDW